jgi:hypothetical protein
VRRNPTYNTLVDERPAILSNVYIISTTISIIKWNIT